jgi:hypothetical protein
MPNISGSFSPNIDHSALYPKVFNANDDKYHTMI